MATNKFLEFNTDKANMLTDVEYAVDTQRQSGVSGIAKAKLHNKLFRQVTVMAAAIGEFIKGAGNDATDTDVATLAAAIGNTFATKAGLDQRNTFETAGGTGTAITLASAALTDKYSTTFIASGNNSGAATTINGKPLYKPGGTSAPTLTAGKAYTIWYSLSGGCFFIKASAEGTAVAGDVLAAKTFSNDTDNGITGTIPSKTAATYNPSTAAQTISSGQYLSGAQTIAATTGTAVTDDVLSGKTFNSASGIGVTGTLPRQNGDGNGYTNMNMYVGNAWASGTGRLHFPIAKGAYIDNANQPGLERNTPMGYIDDGNYIAANILSGKSIFGLQGAAIAGKRFASGTGFAPNGTVPHTEYTGETVYSSDASVEGLSFKPSCIIILSYDAINYNGGTAYTTYIDPGPPSLPEAKVACLLVSKQRWDLSRGVSYRLNNDIYVTNTSFKLPHWNQNVTFTWVAYE